VQLLGGEAEMGYARYVDRIWALAVALGIGGDIFKT